MWDFNLFKDNVAFLSDDDDSCTYKEIIAFCEQQKKFFDRKSLILCLLQNSIDSLLGYIGFLQNKQVPLMVNNNIENDSLLKLVEKYKPNFLWVPKEYKQIFTSFEEMFNNKTFCLLKNREEFESELNSDLSILASTSGSTGSQKYVRQSYQNIRSNTKAILTYLPICERDLTITTLPCHYTFGASVIHTHLMVGSKIILTDHSISQKRFWTTFGKYDVSTLYGVPYTFEILDRLKFFSKPRKKLRIIAQAGGRLSQPLQEKIAEYSGNFKKLFFCMYGQAEATTRIAYLDPQKTLRKLGSIGQPLKNGELYIADDLGKKITNPYEIGNLIYKGPNVCMGYARQRDDLRKGDEWFGKLQTGDLAQIDIEGYFYITGRKKRVAKIFGSSINLDEIEEILRSEFTDLDVAVISDDKKIFLVHVSKATGHLSNFLSKKIMINASVYVETIFEKIPRTSSNKISYFEIAQLLKQRDLL